MTIKTELTAMKKDLTAIGKKLEKLLKAFEKDVKAKVTKVSKAKSVKAKPTKKAPKAPAKKKAVKATATDQVLNIINRSKKGVDTATIKKKTGFNDKKVRNILQRTYKQGKIKRADKGIYVGVK
jgi:glutamate mutase epsilon subunit